MKSLTGIILLLAVYLSVHAQDNSARDGIIVFYTTEPIASRFVPPMLYADNRRLGEITRKQFIRVVLSRGTYNFALAPDVPLREQLSVSIKGGQEIFLRVTREGFFWGNAAEVTRMMPSFAEARLP